MCTCLLLPVLRCAAPARLRPHNHTRPPAAPSRFPSARRFCTHPPQPAARSQPKWRTRSSGWSRHALVDQATSGSASAPPDVQGPAVLAEHGYRSQLLTIVGLPRPGSSTAPLQRWLCAAEAGRGHSAVRVWPAWRACNTAHGPTGQSSDVAWPCNIARLARRTQGSCGGLERASGRKS